ncbi:MAG: hypothetical protein AB1796_15495 [Bacillota bacterium]
MLSRKKFCLLINLLIIILLLPAVLGGCSSPILPGNKKETAPVTESPAGEIEIVYESDIDLSNLRDNQSLDEIFTLTDSLFRVQQVKDALESFKELTEKSKGKLTQRELEEIGNTSWEMQYLGFHNWMNSLEGTLRKQDYLIKKLELELARKQYEVGEIAEDELKQKETLFLLSKNEFQLFIDAYRIAD